LDDNEVTWFTDYEFLFRPGGPEMMSEQKVQTSRRVAWKRLLTGSLYAALLVPVPALALTSGPAGSWHAGGVSVGSLFSFEAPADRYEMAKTEQQTADPAADDGDTVTVLDDWTETGPTPPPRPKRPKSCPPGHHRHQGPGNSFSCGRARSASPR